MATDNSAVVSENCFDDLKAPVKLITAPHAPVPFSPVREDAFIPAAADIEAAVRQVTARGH